MLFGFNLLLLLFVLRKTEIMRLKIKLGFILLGLVLFLAGVTSYIELTRLTSSVQLLIDNGAKSISLSKGVLDILQEQNSRVLNFYVDKSMPISTLGTTELEVMDSLYQQALHSYPKSEELMAIASAKKEYLAVFDEKIDSSYTELSNWYISKYNVAYNHFTTSIKTFMLSSQQYVAKQTDRLKGNIYRTTMQSVVALSVSILILFVFFLLIDLYYMKPIAEITKSLERYLNNGISFNVKAEGSNEALKLKELIILMIQRLKEK